MALVVKSSDISEEVDRDAEEEAALAEFIDKLDKLHDCKDAADDPTILRAATEPIALGPAGNEDASHISMEQTGHSREDGLPFELQVLPPDRAVCLLEVMSSFLLLNVNVVCFT
jgi:hypothetical protein